MTLNELLFVCSDDILVNLTQATITEPLCGSALLLNKMLDKTVLNAPVLRTQPSSENHIPVLDVQIEDTFTMNTPKTNW